MRIQTRVQVNPGSLSFNGSTIASNPLAKLEQIEDDATKPLRPGRPLWITKELRLGTMSGVSFERHAENFTPQYMQARAIPDLEYDLADLRRIITRQLAETNPSTGSTNYSETLAELPKLPDLLKIAGDTHLKKYGNAFLNIQFGWAPLIGDLSNFLFVAADTDAMLARIKRLGKGGSFSSKRQLKRYVAPISRSQKVIQSQLIFVEATEVIESSIKGHTYCRFSPDGSGAPSSASAQRVQAYTAAKGLKLGLYEAWQLVPWSWLIDWSFNMSEYLKATQNVIGATVTEAYAATHSQTVIKFENVSDWNGITWNRKPLLLREHKRRIPLSPDILPSVPVLNPYRAGVLSALIAKWV